MFESQSRHFVKGRQTKIGDKICVSKCLNSSCMRLYFAAVLLLYSGEDSFFETQLAFSDWTGVSGEDILSRSMAPPKRGKFPKTTQTMMYLWYIAFFQAWEPLSPFRWG
ncbi:hypothetical protein TNCV_299761, partial [Trichonephila clavipes]